jgi:hypothetical protein
MVEPVFSREGAIPVPTIQPLEKQSPTLVARAKRAASKAAATKAQVKEALILQDFAAERVPVYVRVKPPETGPNSASHFGGSI